MQQQYPALVSAVLHPLWVLVGVTLNTASLAVYYQIETGRRYRDFLLIVSVGSAVGLGILLDLEIMSVLLRTAPWISILALLFGSAHSIPQDTGHTEIVNGAKM